MAARIALSRIFRRREGMKYLLYGVMRQNLVRWPPELGIRVLTTNGLAAAVSAMEDVDSPPSVSAPAGL